MTRRTGKQSVWAVILFSTACAAGAQDAPDAPAVEQPAAAKQESDAATEAEVQVEPGGEAQAELGDALVLELAYGFEGGSYDSSWGGSGSPVDLVHRGKTILVKGESGTFCCGYTFAIGMLAAQERGLIEEHSPKEIKYLQKMWFGNFPDTTPENKDLRERQVQIGLPTLGIGHAVEHDDALPGDFLQFWRTKSGHSVIFLGWVEEDSQRVGVRYRSSQGSTDGIADKEERFQGHGGSVDPERMYFGRLNRE